MTSRRSKLEIYVDIMEEIRSGTILPTKIMYAANLSWKPLQQILKSLVTQELIEEYMADDGDKRTKKAYRITEKGQNVLHYFRKAEALVDRESPMEIRNWQ